MEQRRHWKFGKGSLAAKPNPDSFDIEFSLTGIVLQHTTYTYEGGVYRSKGFEYDDTGRVIRVTEFGSAGAEAASSEFAYSEGKCVCTTYDAQGFVTSRAVDEYDGERLMLLSTYDANGAPKLLRSFQYAEGKLLQSVSKCYGYDGQLCEQSITGYDPQGRVAKTLDSKPTGHRWATGSTRTSMTVKVVEARFGVLTIGKMSLTPSRFRSTGVMTAGIG